VVASTDQESAPWAGLLLEVTLQAERLIALSEHALINRSMRLVTGVTILAQRFVLEDKRTPLRRMALETRVVTRGQLGPAALDRRTFMRVMTRTAAHFPLQDRVMVRKRKLSTHVQMALETGLGGAPRINDGTSTAALFYVHATRPVTRLTANLLAGVARQPGVGRSKEIPRRLFVAGRTGFRSDEFRAGNTRRRNQRPRGAAGNEDQGQGRPTTRNPQPVCAITKKPPRYSQKS
jgi:hypothetical protein